MIAVAIKTVTQPAIEPVELADVRRHIKASSTDDNSTINLIIQTAREYVEQESGLIMINTELQWFLDSYGKGNGDLMPWWDGIREGAISEYQCGGLVIPRGPVYSVTHIKTYDNLDAATTWNAANYQVDLMRGRITPRLGQSWPIYTRQMNGIEVQFKAGHGEEAKDVPALARLAIMMQCAHLYQNRGDLVDSKMMTAPKGVDDLIDKFKIKSVA